MAGVWQEWQERYLRWIAGIFLEHLADFGANEINASAAAGSIGGLFAAWGRGLATMLRAERSSNAGASSQTTKAKPPGS